MVSINALFNAFLALSAASSTLSNAISLLMGKINREKNIYLFILWYLAKLTLLFLEFVVNYMLLPLLYPIRLILQPYMQPKNNKNKHMVMSFVRKFFKK